MKRLIANTILHLLIGAGSFVIFWMEAYRASVGESWSPAYVAGLICALVAFGTSYCGSRFLAPGQNKKIPALAFVAAFGLSSIISSVGAFGGENIIWEPLAFWFPITVGLFFVSYWGGKIASKERGHSCPPLV